MIEVIVIPWPRYAEDGSSVTWDVSVAEPKRVHRGLQWSVRLGRFRKSWSLMNLRRSAPAAHTEAVRFMREFCAKATPSNEANA